MLLAELSFAGGEILLLVIGILAFAGGFWWMVELDRGLAKEEKGSLQALLLPGIIIIMIAIMAASSRGPTVRAQEHLSAQGITPISVDVDRKTATVKYHDCVGVFTLEERGIFQVGYDNGSIWQPLQTLNDPAYLFCEKSNIQYPS